jgi:hypothetical protein
MRNLLVFTFYTNNVTPKRTDFSVIHRDVYNIVYYVSNFSIINTLTTKEAKTLHCESISKGIFLPIQHQMTKPHKQKIPKLQILLWLLLGLFLLYSSKNDKLDFIFQTGSHIQQTGTQTSTQNQFTFLFQIRTSFLTHLLL